MSPTPDYFSDLNVSPFINAVGPYSSLGGAHMWPEVIDAMDYAVKNKARMSDLHDAVGKRIAELTGVESPSLGSCSIVNRLLTHILTQICWWTFMKFQAV